MRGGIVGEVNVTIAEDIPISLVDAHGYMFKWDYLRSCIIV